jgi:ATP-binding cassette subfamily F protein 3
VKPFKGDLADHGRLVLGQAPPAPQKQRRDRAPLPAEAGRKRDPAPLRRELASLESKMYRFQDLLRRIDEALAAATARGGEALKMADLAGKRAALERALTASEEAWLELSEQSKVE